MLLRAAHFACRGRPTLRAQDAAVGKAGQALQELLEQLEPERAGDAGDAALGPLRLLCESLQELALHPWGATSQRLLAVWLTALGRVPEEQRLGVMVVGAASWWWVRRRLAVTPRLVWATQQAVAIKVQT